MTFLSNLSLRAWPHRLAGLLLLACMLAPAPLRAEEEAGADTSPVIEFDFGPGKDGKAKPISTSLKVVVMMTLLSLAPALLVMMTAFTRIIIVLGFLRHALSTQQIPPNIVLIGLSLFMTMFVMGPVWNEVYTTSYKPYMDGKMGHEEALTKGLVPLRQFMGRQTRQKDLALFVELAGDEQPETFDDIKTTTLVPAFVISELRSAFQMGFLIFLPFIVIDLVVASILMSLGMVMLPPSMIALPFKLLLFVLADGWYLVVKSLVVSFGVSG